MNNTRLQQKFRSTTGQFDHLAGIANQNPFTDIPIPTGPVKNPIFFEIHSGIRNENDRTISLINSITDKLSCFGPDRLKIAPINEYENQTDGFNTVVELLSFEHCRLQQNNDNLRTILTYLEELV
jgi:hypothetical protein